MHKANLWYALWWIWSLYYWQFQHRQNEASHQSLWLPLSLPLRSDNPWTRACLACKSKKKKEKIDGTFLGTDYSHNDLKMRLNNHHQIAIIIVTTIIIIIVTIINTVIIIIISLPLQFRCHDHHRICFPDLDSSFRHCRCSSRLGRRWNGCLW